MRLLTYARANSSFVFVGSELEGAAIETDVSTMKTVSVYCPATMRNGSILQVYAGPTYTGATGGHDGESEANVNDKCHHRLVKV
jgi:hypothetical protein